MFNLKFKLSTVLVVFNFLVTIIAAPLPVSPNSDRNPSPVLLPRTGAFAQTGKTLLARKNWFIKQLDKHLIPPRDKALFWSGGDPVNAVVTEYAHTHHKITLMMALKKEGITLPWTGPYSDTLWDHASKLWAERSKGEVVIFLGKVRQESRYNKIEKPILETKKKKGDVTRVEEHKVLDNSNGIPKVPQSEPSEEGKGKGMSSPMPLSLFPPSTHNARPTL